jgi:membrane glycosyltransferase
LPELPGGVHVLSHDQIEAVLMRRAGYEVRVLPEEDLGWEENPPTLLEFIRRDLRWCRGNMQYFRFLVMPGLKLISRYQIGLAILMFIGSPAWMGLLVVGTIAVALAPTSAAFIDARLGHALLAIVFVMWFAPQFATAADILVRADARRDFGGAIWFAVGLIIEIVFTMLLVPIMWFGHAVYLFSLPFARTTAWTGQTRDDHAVPAVQAMRELWPHNVLGLAVIGVLALTHPSAIPYALFLACGLALAIPLAILTAMPAFGGALARIGLCSLPEETAPPEILRARGLAATALKTSPPHIPPA